jgi:hypothetical protein
MFEISNNKKTMDPKIIKKLLWLLELKKLYKFFKIIFVSVIDGFSTTDINGSIETILVISINPWMKIPNKSIKILFFSYFENNKKIAFIKIILNKIVHYLNFWA